MAVGGGGIGDIIVVPAKAGTAGDQAPGPMAAPALAGATPRYRTSRYWKLSVSVFAT